MFRKIIASILCSLLIHAQVSLGCDKPVTYVEEGKPAPCTGYIFSPEKEQEVRVMVQENKLQKEEIILKTKKIDLLLDSNKYLEEIAIKEQQKAELWRNRAEDSTEKLVSAKSNRGTRDWLFLVGGVLLTVGAGIAIGQASNK